MLETIVRRAVTKNIGGEIDDMSENEMKLHVQNVALREQTTFLEQKEKAILKCFAELLEKIKTAKSSISYAPSMSVPLPFECINIVHEYQKFVNELLALHAEQNKKYQDRIYQLTSKLSEVELQKSTSSTTTTTSVVEQPAIEIPPAPPAPIISSGGPPPPPYVYFFDSYILDHLLLCQC